MVLFFTILAEVPQVQWLTNEVPSQEGKWSQKIVKWQYDTTQNNPKSAKQENPGLGGWLRLVHAMSKIAKSFSFFEIYGL